jgi:Fic family protein
MWRENTRRPPDPPIALGSLMRLLDEANLAVGRLDGAALMIPNLLLSIYVRKEAVLSFQIRGIQSSLSDLLQFEDANTPVRPIGHVQEVSNHVEALEFGMGRIRGGVPVSLSLLQEMHAVLLSRSSRGQKIAGEFGNASFVPPPPEQVLDCLAHSSCFFTTTAPRFRCW